MADKEREAQLSNNFRDIATIVMAKTVNPETEHPYTITMIERLMREVHFAVDPHRNSKQQVNFRLDVSLQVNSMLVVSVVQSYVNATWTLLFWA